MEQRLSHKIIRNTFYNIAGRFSGIFVAIFLTPYIVRHIGLERFGIWAIVGTVTGYFGFFDFGIGMSFVKYIAEFHAKKDYKKLNEVINSGLIFYSIFAAVIIVLTPLYIHPLLGILKIPQYLYDDTVFAFFVGVTIFCVSNALSIFFAIQSGLQRMDITNKLGIFMTIPSVAGTIFVLQNGWGLRGLIINNALICAISSIASIVIAFRILPELKLSLFKFSARTFKKLFGFGSKLQIARMASLVAMNIDKLLIAYFLSMKFVTFFQLSSSVVEQVKSFGLLFLGALVPAFSQLEAKNGRAELIDGYIRGTKYLALITIPMNIFTIIFAHQIMYIWMGLGYENSVRMIQILGLTWGIAILCGMRAVIVQAIARPDIEMKAGLIAAILNIPLSIILIIKFGFLGVAFGTLIAFLASAAYGTVKFHKELKLPLRQLIRTKILSILAVCVCAGILVRGLTVLSYGFFKQDRITTFAVFIVQGLLFFGVYLSLLLFTKPLDNGDLAMLSEGKANFAKNLLSKFSR